ncbi:MAG: hypothetical protein U0930_05910 [Pirellulales bacterium]
METNTKLDRESVTGDLGLDDPKATELSSEFIVRWEKLISTTNWEKGKIIFDWREALIGSQANATAYSDEAWSKPRRRRIIATRWKVKKGLRTVRLKLQQLQRPLLDPFSGSP